MAISSQAALMLILNCTIKKSVNERVSKCVIDGKCVGTQLVKSGEPGAEVEVEIDCDKPVHNRGLCKQCYGEWYNARRSMTDQEKMQFDHELIEMGRLLHQQGKRQYEQRDLLARLARKVKRRA